MSQPIQTQSQQFAVFGDDSAKRAIREPVATVYVDHDVHDYLAGPSIHAGLNVTANRRTAGDFDAVYDHSRPSLSDLHAHEPHHMNEEEFGQEFPQGEPPVDEGYAQEPGVPLQPLHEMLDHTYRPDPREPSFRSARHGGPELHTGQAVAPAQPGAPAAPVWLGHTYVPGHRVGLPWGQTTIPGTVTHLEGYNIGVLWDDGQHTVEEPAGVRPLY